MDKKETPRQPVEYLVKEKSLIGNEIKEAGEKVLYDGLPAENLEPLCDEGRARYQEYLASNKARVAAMVEQHNTSAVGDPDAFAKAMAKYQAEQAEVMKQAISEGIAAGIAQAMTAIANAQQTSAAEVAGGPAPGPSATDTAANAGGTATSTKGPNKGKDSLV